MNTQKIKKLLLPSINVGNKEPKVVTKLNHKLFRKAIVIMRTDSQRQHYGNKGISAFIDWLEETYNMVKIVKEIK